MRDQILISAVLTPTGWSGGLDKTMKGKIQSLKKMFGNNFHPLQTFPGGLALIVLTLDLFNPQCLTQFNIPSQKKIIVMDDSHCRRLPSLTYGLERCSIG